MQQFIHYFLHLGLPFFIAYVFFKKDWKKAYVLFLLTMLVDLDHLFTTPFFDPNRCSIQFHPLHGYYAMGVYLVLLFFKKPFNLIGIGLLFHMFTDLVDCMMMFEKCQSCFEEAPAGGLLRSISDLFGIG